MSFKFLNTFTAIGSLINAGFYLLAPAFSLFLMGANTNAVGLLNTRVAGACALGICVIDWGTRQITDSHIQRIISTGNLIMFVPLVTAEIHGTLSGAINWVGWLFILTDTFLAIGYARLLIQSSGSNR